MVRTEPLSIDSIKHSMLQMVPGETQQFGVTSVRMFMRGKQVWWCFDGPEENGGTSNCMDAIAAVSVAYAEVYRDED